VFLVSARLTARRINTIRQAMRKTLSLLQMTGMLLVPVMALAGPPEIHAVTGKNGVKFRHFEIHLSSENTLLPGDPKINRKRLDEYSENFEYGQFEVFIPAKSLSLGLGCKSHYIVRMPMTLGLGQKTSIKQKQELFYAIKKAVESKTGTVHVVIELTYNEGCNLFFRDGPGGHYIGYVGAIRR